MGKLVTDDPAVQFADVENEFVYTDGHQRFLPRSGAQSDTGYISQKMSNAEGIFYKASTNYRKFVHSGGTIQGFRFEDIKYGKFISGNVKVDFTSDSTDNPTLSVTWETAWTFYDMQLEFADVCPKSLIIHSYLEGTETEAFAVEDLDFSTPIQHDFYEVDQVIFEFVETNPYQRIHLEKIVFGNSVGYTLDYRDMTATPVATRAEFVRNVDVIYTKFTYGTTEEEISTIDAVVGENEVIFDNAYHNLRAAYSELPDDDETHTKMKKKFVTALPAPEDAVPNTLYIINSFYVYRVVTSNNVKSWDYLGLKIAYACSTLPSTPSNSFMYMLETDNPYITHLYMNYNNGSETELVSLGYMVSGTIDITVSDCAYYAVITSNVASPIDIYGIPYTVSEKTYNTRINDVGVDKTAKNVLIDNLEHAQEESAWLADYYANDVEYKIQYRGEPSLEPDDMIYIENKFVEKNKVRIVNSQIDTGTGMSMSCIINGRRISYE